MDGGSVLGLLKWVALALGLASTLWGLLAGKPTVEGEDGRKRLTAAGTVTLALIVGSSLVAATAYGFETLTKRADAAAALAKDQEATAALAVRNQRDWMTNAQTRVIAAEQRAAVAEARAVAAGQRATAVALAAEARVRDLQLSRDVEAGTSRNLERTSRALGELERLIQPLEPLTVTVVWELGREVPGVAAWGARAAAEFRRRDAEGRERQRGIAAGTVYCRIECDFKATDVLEIAPGSALYPRYAAGDRTGENDLLADVVTLRGIFAFFAGASVPAARPGKTGGGLPSQADLGFTLTPRNPNEEHRDKPIVRYIAATGALRVTLSDTVPLDRMQRSGKIVSYPDLERSLLLVELADGPGRLPGHRGIRPVELTLASPTREYRAETSAFRRVEPMDRSSVYTVAKLIPKPR